jgi:Pectate lyase superfamily protein
VRLNRFKLIFLLTLVNCIWIRHAAAEPAIFWFNDPVDPDQTVLVTGAELGDVTAVAIGRIPDRDSGDGKATTQSIPVLQPNPQSLKFVIPREFERGIYQFTLASPQGRVSGRINLPTVYWTQGSLGAAVAPGGWIQVFGRNIIRRKDHARLVLVPESGAGGSPIAAILNDGDTWRGKFSIPNGVRPGLYRLRLSNGDGGESEWVDAGPIEVRAPEAAADRVFDVRAYGANGDGRANSTRGIVNAVAAAEQAGGGTVYFPRGRYVIIETLVVPPNVAIKGERTDLVNLVWPDFSDPPDALIKGTTHFSIEDVTIYASNHRHVVVGGFLDGNRPAPDASDIAIRRVRIRASAFRGQLDLEATVRRMTEINRLFPSSGPDTIRLSGDRLELIDCDVVGSGRSLFLFNASNAVISGNILVNGRYGWYSITGSRRIIFEENHISAGDLQGNGGGINTLSNSVSASENIFVGHNTFKGIYGLDREGMTTDGPGGYYFGNAETVAPQRLSLHETADHVAVSPDWVGAAVMVVDGLGVGQSARVAKLERAPDSSQTWLDLDRPLQVGLDSTSVITVAQAKENYLIIDNQFEDCGVAAQSYGTGLNHVIAGNTSNRTGGFFAIGLSYLHFQPGWQIQLLNNRIIEGNIYRAGLSRNVLSEESAIGIHAYRSEIRPGAPPLARAMVVRGNRLEQDAHIEIKGSSSVAPGVRDVIIEWNTIGASRIGLFIDQGVVSALERNNVIERRITK